jgi:acetyl esterase/lipase
VDVELVDPELRAAVKRLPTGNAASVTGRRVIRLATRIMPVKAVDGVAVSTIRDGAVRGRLYQPTIRKTGATLLWIHGGGFFIGDARQDEAMCAGTALELGMTVFSVNYRLAPEHPFPAPLADVRQGWEWLQQHASQLEVDPKKVAVGGESAGGGLAAALVQQLHDQSSIHATAQWLFAPMLDDRTAADTSLDAIKHWVWSNTDNRFGWGAYLGGRHGDDVPPPYAAPGRRSDLNGLPPTYIAVGDIELFLKEDTDFADRLKAAGVSTELDIIPGAPHGFENWARDSEVSQRLLRRARDWLRDTIDGNEGKEH